MKNGYYSSPGDDQELFMNHDYDQIKTLRVLGRITDNNNSIYFNAKNNLFDPVPLKWTCKNEHHKSRLKTLKN